MATQGNPSTRKPIGVPANVVGYDNDGNPVYSYTVTKVSPGAEYVDPFAFNPNYQRESRYHEGDQFSPAGQPVENIVGLQQALVEAGFLGRYIPGVWDDASVAAYEEAMGVANRMGLSIDDVLNGAAGAGGRTGGGGGGGGGGGSAPKLPNPEDVKALMNDAAYKQIGKNLDGPALDAAVQAFYSAYQAGGQYQAPDATTISEQYIKSSAPEEVQAHASTKVYDVISNMLGGIQ